MASKTCFAQEQTDLEAGLSYRDAAVSQGSARLEGRLGTRRVVGVIARDARDAKSAELLKLLEMHENCSEGAARVAQK